MRSGAVADYRLLIIRYHLDMTAELKPYPTMKDSGVEWFGMMPEHWEVRKLRTILHNVAERNRPDLPLLSVVREKGVIVRNISNKEENHNFIPDDLTNYKVVRKGQFAMNKMKAWQGSYGVSDYDGIVSPAYYVFDLHGVSGDFFNVAIRSKSYVPFFTQASDGVRVGQWDLSRTRMQEIKFLIPPVPEQVAIARYLDYVDVRVRRLTEAKRKLIGLLTEQKQAIIHRAVTRGLDPNVPLKNSGLLWCPEVPSHWELKPNREFLKQRKMLVGDRHTDYTLLSLTKQGVIVRDLTDNKGKFSTDMGTSQEVQRGNLVMCLFDVQETPRTLGISQYDGMITGAYTVFDVCNDGIARWLERFYIAMDDQKALSPLYSGLRNTIPKPRFLGIKTPIPPMSEQVAIVEYLDRATAEIDIAVARAERQIELLNEYRTRLIADVVTGKLDVRDVTLTTADTDTSTSLASTNSAHRSDLNRGA